MSLIVSVHIYSVQKALLRDSGPLYSVDYDAVKDNLKNCSRHVDHINQGLFTQAKTGKIWKVFLFIKQPL